MFELSVMETIGYIGAACFAICPLPQVIKSVKDKHSAGLSWGFLGLWLSGEIAMLIYAASLHSRPLIINYVTNLLLLSVILFYKLFPKQQIAEIVSIEAQTEVPSRVPSKPVGERRPIPFVMRKRPKPKQP